MTTHSTIIPHKLDSTIHFCEDYMNNMKIYFTGHS